MHAEPPAPDGIGASIPARVIDNHPAWATIRRRMRIFTGRPPRHFLRSALLAALALFCGCQTSTQSLFTASGPEWKVQTGQALWRPGHKRPEIGGDLVIARDPDGRRLVEFDKTPISIVSAQTTSNRWVVHFPQQNLNFGGHGPGSTRFIWLYLPTALDGGTLPATFHFERKPDGGWRLENTGTGESVEGFLTP
jgi:hypothetical protein